MIPDIRLALASRRTSTRQLDSFDCTGSGSPPGMLTNDKYRLRLSARYVHFHYAAALLILVSCNFRRGRYIH